MLYMSFSIVCGEGFPFLWKLEHFVDAQKKIGNRPFSVHRWKWLCFRLDYAIKRSV